VTDQGKSHPPAQGASQPDGRDAVDWIRHSTPTGPTVHSAIPPGFACYATIVVPSDDREKSLTDAALVEVLRSHSDDEIWWLGYLDTGGAPPVDPQTPRVRLYAGWDYVLLQGGPQKAPAYRTNKDSPFHHSALPELVFPCDRSWLLSTLWDDDWRCVGGSTALVEDLLERPELEVRCVRPGDDMTPPGHVLR
jgi:hypothetical protein